MTRGKIFLVSGLLLLAACGREGTHVAEPAPASPIVEPTIEPAATEEPAEDPHPTAKVYATVITPEPTPEATARATTSTPSPSPAPTATHKAATPPPSFVRSQDGEQQGRLGSYCWYSHCRTQELPHGRPKSGLLDMFVSEKTLLRWVPDDLDPSQITIEFRQNSEPIATQTPKAQNPTVFNTSPPKVRYWLIVTAKWTGGRTTHVFAVNVFEKATPEPG